MIRVVLTGLSALGLAACSSSTSVTQRSTANPANVTQAVCSKDAKTRQTALPSGFPSTFPLPPGTVVYSVDDRGADGIVITGVTASPFATVLKALQTTLPSRGFTPKDGESEPHDAESDWTSKTYEGRWAIREIPQCSGDTLVSVVARRS